MKKNVYIMIGIASALLLVCCSIWGVNISYDGYTGPDYPIDILNFVVTGSSRIEPQTLLQSIEDGGTNVFQMESEIPENPQFVMLVEWTQAEFMMVANALFQLVWKEPMNNWNLYRMNFVTTCKDDPKGFGHLDLFFYQDAIVNRIKKYSVRTIRLYPDYGYVAWGGDTYWHRPLLKWKTINLSNMKVPAEKALNIMEAKGGKDFRMSVKNACEISVNLNPELYNRYAWQGGYWSENLYYNMKLWIPLK